MNSENKNSEKPNPITTQKEVEKNPDPKIDQDMPGFPHHPAHEDDIAKKDPTPKANEKQHNEQ